jgi:hypothetical protein
MSHELLKKYSLEVAKKHLDPAVTDLIVGYASWVRAPYKLGQAMRMDSVCFVCGRRYHAFFIDCSTFTKCGCTGPRCGRCEHLVGVLGLFWSHGTCFWHRDKDERLTSGWETNEKVEKN